MSSAPGPASFDPLIKENTFQYPKGILAATKWQSSLFTGHPQEMKARWKMSFPKDETPHLKTWRGYLWERYFQKEFLQPRWKGPCEELLTSRGATTLQGTGSWVHASSQESTKQSLVV